MLTPILAIFWKATALMLGLTMLSGTDNPRLSRASFGRMLWIVLIFSGAGTLLSALGFLALPVVVVGWVVWWTAWFGIFAVYFGLGPGRAAGLFAVQALAQYVFMWLMKVLPLVDSVGLSSPFGIWSFAERFGLG